MRHLGKHCLSKVYQPIINVPKSSNISHKDVTSKSQRLMLELGLIQQASTGFFHILPMCYKSLSKLIKIVDNEMSNVGGQKVIMPTLTNQKLWKNSGRLKDAGPELLQIQDRHNHSYILSPTHEEAISDLLSGSPLSYKSFPLRLYQMTSKFRDEMRPRYGLMRGREFLMKDLYCFDIDLESAKRTYEEVCESYDNIFMKLGLHFVKVLGASGNMGGSQSHEYQLRASLGEDQLFFCKKCNYSANAELCGTEKCPNCGEETTIMTQYGIEVGHTFLLGDRYSKPLKALYLSKNGKTDVLQMGSYGLGLTRILAATVEVLSSETEITWPDALAPYNVVIIPPKAGSREEQSTIGLADKIYEGLEKTIPGLVENVLIDDRVNFTIGRRYLEAKRMGYRYIIVINQHSSESIPIFEFTDSIKSVKLHLTNDQFCDYIKENTVFEK